MDKINKYIERKSLEFYNSNFEQFISDIVVDYCSFDQYMNSDQYFDKYFESGCHYDMIEIKKMYKVLDSKDTNSEYDSILYGLKESIYETIKVMFAKGLVESISAIDLDSIYEDLSSKGMEFFDKKRKRLGDELKKMMKV